MMGLRHSSVDIDTSHLFPGKKKHIFQNDKVWHVDKYAGQELVAELDNPSNKIEHLQHFLLLIDHYDERIDNKITKSHM